MYLAQEELNYLRVRFNIPLFYIGHIDSDNQSITFTGLGDTEYIVLLDEDKVIEVKN